MKTPFKNNDLLLIDSRKPATHSIIWLHGLGASAHDFESIIPYLQRMPSFQSVRFIFPQAPNRPVTINQGYVMPAWYDILQMDKHGPQDQEGIEQSSAYLQALIDEQISNGISAENIYLIGFSQGAAMVLYTSLVYQKTLGGIVDLSGYLPLIDVIKKQAMQNPGSLNKSNRYWVAHGQQDVVVPIIYNEESVAFLKTFTNHVSFHSYPMGHEICQQEIDDMAAWLCHMFQQGNPAS